MLAKSHSAGCIHPSTFPLRAYKGQIRIDLFICRQPEVKPRQWDSQTDGSCSCWVSICGEFVEMLDSRLYSLVPMQPMNWATALVYKDRLMKQSSLMQKDVSSVPALHSTSLLLYRLTCNKVVSLIVVKVLDYF